MPESNHAKNQDDEFEVVPGWNAYRSPDRRVRYWQRTDGNAEVMHRGPAEFEVNTWHVFKTGRGRMQRLGSFPTLNGAFTNADSFCPPESNEV